jgi:predicted MFS family arabinose efflux permease
MATIAAPSLTPARPSRGAWAVLAILCFVYVLNFLDRQLLSILAKPIQDELGVTDGQLGMIGGLYFALFYCLISIPVAFFADRTNRVKVVAFACALWSAATVACGLSRNYPELVAARMTVGLGEAGGVPPSYAIITDYFPPGTRGTALGLFNLGPPIGQAMGVAFGASIAASYSWRDAFVALGVVGIVTAASVYVFVREPKRGGLDAAPGGRVVEAAAPFRATCRMFFTRRVLLLTALACAATQFITYGMLNFATLFLMREKGMTLNEIAIWYALVVGVGISAGMIISGRLIDRYVRRTKKAYAIIPAIGLAVAIPFFVGFVWAQDWGLALALLLVPMGFNYFYLSAAVTLVQEEVRPNQRVLAGALLLLVMNLVGLGLGPTWVGALSDWLKPSHPANSLQLAFTSLVPFYFLAIGLFLALARALGREEQVK